MVPVLRRGREDGALLVLRRQEPVHAGVGIAAAGAGAAVLGEGEVLAGIVAYFVLGRGRVESGAAVLPTAVVDAVGAHAEAVVAP